MDFVKNQTLKENKDFRRLYYRGRCHATETVVVYAQKNRLGSCRYGITTGKKIGNAVTRNRARRIIRVAFAALEPRVGGSYDFVFVARSKTGEVKMQQVLKDMTTAFANIGVINEQN